MKRLACFALLLAVSCSEEAPPPPPAQPLPTKPAEPPKQPATAPAAPATVTTGPRVVTVDGECMVDGKSAVVGTPVTPTSVVETKAKSKMTLTLGPGSLIQVREASKV